MKKKTAKAIIATIFVVFTMIFCSFMILFLSLDRVVIARTPFHYPSSKWSGEACNLYIYSNGKYGVWEYTGEGEKQIYYIVLYNGDEMGVFDTDLDIGVDITADPYYGRTYTDENGKGGIGGEIQLIYDADLATYSFSYRGQKTLIAHNSSPNEMFPETIHFELVETDISKEDIPH